MDNRVNVIHDDGNETEIHGVTRVEYKDGLALVRTSTSEDRFRNVKAISFGCDMGKGIGDQLSTMRPWSADQVAIVDIAEIEADGMSQGKEMSIKVLNESRFGRNMAMDSFVDQTGMINLLVYGSLWIRIRPKEFFKLSDALRACFEKHETQLKP